MRRRVTVALSRLTRILLLVAVALGLGAPTAGADAAPPLDSKLAALWTTVLQTPAAQNPINTDGCFDLGGGTLAPFGGKKKAGAGPCQVKPGTKIYVAAHSFECSTIPQDDHPKGRPPWSEAQLRKCARDKDVQVAPIVTVDDKPVPVTEVETPLLNITLPADNIIGAPAGTYQSVAHGWVTLLDPLTIGAHTIVGTGSATFTTKITVQGQ